MFAAVKKYLVY